MQKGNKLSDNPASDGASRHTVVKLSELPDAIEAAAKKYWNLSFGDAWSNANDDDKKEFLRDTKQILLAAEKAGEKR